MHNFSVSFDFRTTQQDGIILSTSGTGGAMAVDLYQGQVRKGLYHDRILRKLAYGACRLVALQCWHMFLGKTHYGVLPLCDDWRRRRCRRR